MAPGEDVYMCDVCKKWRSLYDCGRVLTERGVTICMECVFKRMYENAKK